MFGHEAAAKYACILEQQPCYLGDSEGLLDIAAMNKMFQIIGENLRCEYTARKAQN